jgi:hypothetical protein
MLQAGDMGFLRSVAGYRRTNKRNKDIGQELSIFNINEKVESY